MFSSSVVKQLHIPVLPNPFDPRSVSSKDSTDAVGGVLIHFSISCAILSPLWTVKGLLELLI